MPTRAQAVAVATAPATPYVVGGVALVLGGVGLFFLAKWAAGGIGDLAGDLAGGAKDLAGDLAGGAVDLAKSGADQVNIIPEAGEFLGALFGGVDRDRQVFELTSGVAVPEGATIIYSQYGEQEYYIVEAAPLSLAESAGDTTRQQFITLYDEPILDVGGVTILPSVEDSFTYLTEGSILNDTLGGIKNLFTRIF